MKPRVVLVLCSPYVLQLSVSFERLCMPASSFVIYSSCTQVYNSLWANFLLFLLAKGKPCWSSESDGHNVYSVYWASGREWQDINFCRWDLLPSILLILLSLFSKLPFSHTRFSTPLYGNHLLTARYGPK